MIVCTGMVAPPRSKDIPDDATVVDMRIALAQDGTTHGCGTHKRMEDGGRERRRNTYKNMTIYYIRANQGKHGRIAPQSVLKNSRCKMTKRQNIKHACGKGDAVRSQTDERRVPNGCCMTAHRQHK